MNAITISFILPGDEASSEDSLALGKKISTIASIYNNAVELVLYYSKPPGPHPSQKNIICVSSKNISPLKKAIVVSSGEKLVFTTIRNFLADNKNEILNQSLDTAVETISAPLVKNYLGRVGMSRISKTPYIIAKKEYATQVAGHISSFANLLDSAEQEDALVEIKSVDAHLPDYIIRSRLPLRPRGKIKEKPEKKSTKTIRYSEDIPTFIICRDRVEPLKKLVKWCEVEGLRNVIFIDNASTYPPLLRYLSATSYEVIYLNHNVGYLSPWRTGAVDVYAKHKPYIVSDADIIPSPKAHGAVKLFCHLLNNYPHYVKAGFGLMIDDIPESYEPKEYVISWEKQFWQKEIEKDVYDADIDTTFAVWRQNTAHTYGPSLRTGGKYVAKHDGWYIDSKNLSKEMRYYRNRADKEIGTWGAESTELPKTYIDSKNKPSRQPLL